MKLYLVGENSFICKSLLKTLTLDNVIKLSHTDLTKLNDVTSEDIVINFCGINRASTIDEYIKGNYEFVLHVFDIINITQPFFIHFSSLMVYGFENTELNDLPEYQQYFIRSKIAAEELLINNYPSDKLAIIRPSNVFGPDCKPYYNNLLVTLIHEKITRKYTITKINRNCVRNFIHISGLITELIKIVNNKEPGKYNIISNNTINLADLVAILYDNDIPSAIIITDDKPSVSFISKDSIIVNESLKDLIKSDSELIQSNIIP